MQKTHKSPQARPMRTMGALLGDGVVSSKTRCIASAQVSLCESTRMRVLSLTFIVLLLAGCKKSAEISGAASPDGPVAILTRHANGVIASSAGDIERFNLPRMTVSNPPTFLTTFVSSTETFALKQPDGLASTLLKNQSITVRWQETYCTETLKKSMASASIFSAIGEIVDARGKSQTFAVCLVEDSKVLPAATPNALRSYGSFTTPQICRAGLSAVYSGKIGSMETKVFADHVQIKYIRPTDNKLFGYRCRVSDDRLLFWDDSLVGARWYGEQSSDSKTRFSVSSDHLVIRQESPLGTALENSYHLRDVGPSN